MRVNKEKGEDRDNLIVHSHYHWTRANDSKNLTHCKFSLQNQIRKDIVHSENDCSVVTVQNDLSSVENKGNNKRVREWWRIL